MHPSENAFPAPATASGSLAFGQPLLGWFPTWIVGRRFYGTALVARAPLAFIREPDNPHDGDAIAVYALRDRHAAAKVGHLPRYDAAMLAPLVDRGSIRLDGALSDEDEPQDRAPIRVEVLADQKCATLAGPGGRTAEAIWHAQLFNLWQSRALYGHEALAAYRATIREAVHSGGLWPETQLFYRLLKGVVADGKAAEELERHLAVLRAVEEAERRAAVRQATLRAACACEPLGELLRFGGLRVLPLRALRPASVVPLGEALRQRTAVVMSGELRAGRPCLRLVTSPDAADILAVRHEVLDTADGILRVKRDQLLAVDGDGGRECLLETVREDRHPLERPVFLRGCEVPEPTLPELPSESTGFAVFVGSWLRQLVLFGHPGCAAVARSGLRRLPWHLPASDDGLTATEAAARVTRVLSTLDFDGLDPSETQRLASHPGLQSGTLLLLADRLACLRLRVKEGEVRSAEMQQLTQ